MNNATSAFMRFSTNSQHVFTNDFTSHAQLQFGESCTAFLHAILAYVNTNSMKYISNYFEKGQLTKMFFLFPDPHFKEKNHRRRVINPHLLDEYAYVLKVGRIIYTITDVEELGVWMKSCLESHPLFEAVSEDDLEVDPVVKLLSTATEEGQKVVRNEGQTFQAVYRRIASSCPC